MTLQAVTRLGPYEILSPLGVRGMGEVWKAKDTRLDRFVADGDFRQLRHPNITSDTGGKPISLPWIVEPGESTVGWIADDAVMLTHPEDALHLRLERVELSSGRRKVVELLAPPDSANVTRLYNVRVSGDGKTVGFTYTRILVSDLLVAEGLK